MMLSPAAQASFTRVMVGEEGRVAYAYQDNAPEKWWTIGIGRLCDKRKPGSGLSIVEQDYLFGNDCAKIIAAIDARCPWINELDEVRKAGVMNMMFQLGVDGFLGFTNSVKLIRAKRWDEAATNLKQSLWARQTPARAGRVIEQIRSGKWVYAI